MQPLVKGRGGNALFSSRCRQSECRPNAPGTSLLSGENVRAELYT